MCTPMQGSCQDADMADGDDLTGWEIDLDESEGEPEGEGADMRQADIEGADKSQVNEGAERIQWE
jgi:hypothetical protein